MFIGMPKKVIDDEPAPLVSLDPKVAELIGAESLIHNIGEKIRFIPIKLRELVYVKRL